MTPAEIFAAARARGIKQIRLVIFQPRVYSGPQEWTCTLEDLEAFAAQAAERAHQTEEARKAFNVIPMRVWEDSFLNPEPNEDECAFCRAQATCPAARRKLEREVGADFSVVAEGEKPNPGDLDTLDLETKLHAVPFLEDWCKAVRAEIERRLLAGVEMNDWGLELGRQGPRKWRNAEEVEQIMRKQFVLKMEHVYNFKLRSPTQVEEKLAPREAPKRGPNKGVVPESVLGARQWAKLQRFISRSEPKPSVKPKSVITKPYKAEPIKDEFNPVEDDLS